MSTKHLSRTARFFEMQLLDVLGYRPQLNACIQSKEELLPEENFFSPEAGGMLKPQYRECLPRFDLCSGERAQSAALFAESKFS